MSGLIAFLVVMALCVAVGFLGRSMFSHLRKVPATFDPPPEGSAPPPPPRSRS
jgi:hypothetical protein